jgi:single-strand DNA-binding protein
VPENSVTLIGNVVRDPELQFLNNGSAVVKFAVAVSRRWQNQKTHEWEEKTSYVDVVHYGKSAENVAQSVRKGYRVMVTGRVESRTWDTNEGTKRTVIEVIADEVAVSLKFVTAVISRADRPDAADRAMSRRETLPAFDDEPF